MKTWITSGFMRSGTSMMCRALEAGGLQAAFAEDNRQYMNQRHGDKHYQPNPAGYYELDRKEYHEPGFPRKYQGKLIKILAPGLSKIVAGDYNIIMMRRDFEEIRQSYEAFFQGKMAMTEPRYEQLIEDTLGILRVRSDCKVSEVWYRDVIDNPFNAFEYLVDEGWKIDPLKAASIVDEKQLRFRKERLVIGV